MVYIFILIQLLDIAKKVKPSNRGELEITSINNAYMFENKLNIQLMGDGFTWLDTGTPDSLLEASNYIQATEKRQGLKIACIEEIAFKKIIFQKQLYELVKPMIENEYGGYLNKILKMKNENQYFDGSVLISPDSFSDSRGEFYESYNKVFFDFIGDIKFVQDNISKSKKILLEVYIFKILLHPIKVGYMLKRLYYRYSCRFKKKSSTFGCCKKTFFK